MRVMVIGGTGLIGWWVSRSLVSGGHSVVSLARNPSPESCLLSVKYVEGDIRLMTDQEITAVLLTADAVVFAAGLDDRQLLPAPAYPLFRSHNVDPVIRILQLSRDTPVRHLVIVGSYFSAFERMWPELRLADKHAYIRSRKEQFEEARSVAPAGTCVSVFELPFVFGAAPGREPVVAPLVSFLHRRWPVFSIPGGTAVTTVRHVSQAVVRNIENPVAGSIPVTCSNLPWDRFIERVAEAVGKARKIRRLSLPLFRTTLIVLQGWFYLRGKEMGLALGSLPELLTRRLFLNTASDSDETTHRLDEESLQAAVLETVNACLALRSARERDSVRQDAG